MVGTCVGMEDGALDGSRVGRIEVATRVGLPVGDCVGATDGARVGSCDGDSDGETVVRTQVWFL